MKQVEKRSRSAAAIGALLIALALIGIVPRPVSAQNPLRRLPTHRKPHSTFPISKLSLNIEQQTRAAAIQKESAEKARLTLNARQQWKIMAILTPKEAIRDAIENRLALTGEQKAHLREIDREVERRKSRIDRNRGLGPDQRRSAKENITVEGEDEYLKTLDPTQQDRLNKMVRETSDLTLTDDQQQQYARLDADTRKQTRALVDDLNLTREEREAQIDQVEQSAEEQYMEMLTPEQHEQYRISQLREYINATGEPYSQEGLEMLGLEAGQRTRIREVYVGADNQFKGMLNPDQRERFEHEREAERAEREARERKRK